MLWTAWTLLVVVAVAAAVVLMPRGEKVPQTALRTEATDTAPARAPMRFTPARRREADALVRRFAIQAAGRRDPAAAWNDVSAAMQANVSRREWNAGSLPVVPFDAKTLRGISWRVVYRAPDRIGLDVLLVAQPGTRQRTTVYAVDLVLERHRLVVDTWTPRESFGGAPSAAKQDQTSAPTTGREPSFAHGQLDARWLLVPAGVLALAVLVPLGLVVRNAVRNRRAYHDYARARRD